MDGDFRTQFVRDPASLKHFPALVLNAAEDGSAQAARVHRRGCRAAVKQPYMPMVA